MNYLLIIGTFEAVFLILLIFTKKNKSISDLYLGIILFLYGLSGFSATVELYNLSHNFPYPKVLNINWLILFLHGPALWFYVKSLSESNFKLKPIYFLHLLPFIGFTIAHYFHFIQLSDADKILHMQQESVHKEEIFNKISVLCVGISTAGYSIWALQLIQQYRRKLMQSFSKIEDMDLNWLRIFTIAALICFCLNAILFNLNLIFNFAAYKVLLTIVYGFGSVYILFLGYFGIQQRNVFINGNINSIDIKASNLKINKSKSELHRLQEGTIKVLSFMDSNQPFLEPEINISKLGQLLNLKVDFLSEILNNELNQSFFDFINKYRVEEFKIQSLLEANKHLSIMGIAYNCGFNSKATFYRAFKKFEGISPSDYIQRVSTRK